MKKCNLKNVGFCVFLVFDFEKSMMRGETCVSSVKSHADGVSNTKNIGFFWKKIMHGERYRKSRHAASDASRSGNV